MAKLIRCESGHVFDSEGLCPECARLGLVHNKDHGNRDTAGNGAKTKGNTTQLLSIAGVAIPLWLIGSAALAGVGLLFWSLRPATPPATNLQPTAVAPANPAPSAPPSTPQAPPQTAPDSVALAQGLPGRYQIDGLNPDGSSYGGVVTITSAGGTFNVQWRISNNEIYRGRGRLNGDILTVDYGQRFPAIYRVNGDGTLQGRWANGRGSENLIRY